MAIKLYLAVMSAASSSGSAFSHLVVRIKCRIPALQDLAFNIMQMRIIQLCIIYGCGLRSRTCISTEVTRPPRSLASRRGTIFEFESPAVLRLPLQFGVRPHVKEPSWPV